MAEGEARAHRYNAQATTIQITNCFKLIFCFLIETSISRFIRILCYALRILNREIYILNIKHTLALKNIKNIRQELIILEADRDVIGSWRILD